jgi:hypothetical protein
MLKFMSTVPCAKISNLLNNMLSNRFFQVFLQILFNLYMCYFYMSDLPSSSLILSQYADDIALTHQARKFEECEIHLEEGPKTLSRFFHHLTFTFKSITNRSQCVSLGNTSCSQKADCPVWQYTKSLTLTTRNILGWLCTERFPVNHIWKKLEWRWTLVST